jgi:lysophospholipase L1-like esterase
MGTICIFGNSITWGASDVEAGGWVARLRNYFEKSNSDVEVYNCGVSGDNTDELLERFKKEAEAREPDIIIFAIGINDSQYINYRDNPRVDMDKFRANLAELVRQAREFTNKIIFIGLTKVDELKTAPIPWGKDKFYDKENILKYNSEIEKFCQENGLEFIDMFDLLEEDELPDGLHPGPEGHEKMFLQVKKFLQNKKFVDY